MENQITALVVETNYLIASAIEVPLTSKGFKVIIAVTDDETRAALAAHQIHIAIVDFRLSHGGPGGLLSWLSAAGVPYIFCTAASTDVVVGHFPGARVLEKPFLPDNLLALVAQAIDVTAGRAGTR